jgi:hypothetical protein
MSFASLAAIALLSTAAVAAPSPANQEHDCCTQMESAAQNTSDTKAPTPDAAPHCRMSCCSATPSDNVKVNAGASTDFEPVGTP